MDRQLKCFLSASYDTDLSLIKSILLENDIDTTADRLGSDDVRWFISKLQDRGLSRNRKSSNNK